MSEYSSDFKDRLKLREEQKQEVRSLHDKFMSKFFRGRSLYIPEYDRYFHSRWYSEKLEAIGITVEEFYRKHSGLSISLCNNPDCENEIKFSRLSSGCNSAYCSYSCNNHVLNFKGWYEESGQFLTRNVNSKAISDSMKRRLSNPNDLLNSIENLKSRIYTAGKNVRDYNRKTFSSPSELLNLYVVELNDKWCKIGSGNDGRLKEMSSNFNPIFSVKGKSSCIRDLEDKILEMTKDFICISEERYKLLGSSKGFSEVRDSICIGLAYQISKDFCKDSTENFVYNLYS